MRFIDLPKLLKKKSSWGKRDELWKNKNLQSDFREYGFNKCWYTEVKLIFSYLAIHVHSVLT